MIDGSLDKVTVIGPRSLQDLFANGLLCSGGDSKVPWIECGGGMG